VIVFYNFTSIRIKLKQCGTNTGALWTEYSTNLGAPNKRGKNFSVEADFSVSQREKIKCVEPCRVDA
jgi:hypothetical protein